MNKGVELWKKAKEIIPGGNQLLSKRSEMFLPDQWPSYYKSAKGVEIEDLDGNKLIDMSIMGVGACVLGYADPDVNEAVKKRIDYCSMTTLNCPEEVELAKKLLNLNKWAGSVRYARTGGEALAVAVRIARACTSRDKVAFCGYHGWHDWYLSANLTDDEALDGHLLPGLDPKGVPRALVGNTIPFEYNNINSLKKIITKDVGVIVLEPVRHHEPEDDFLKEVAHIANQNGSVLVVDEITSGFRLCVGGVFEQYGITPDIAVFGKAMGNGFPVSAIVGKKNIMDCAQNSFISSTFWTEGIGFSAALATIKKMEKYNVPKHLKTIGNLIGDGWKREADKNKLTIQVVGIPSLISFKIEHEQSQALHTLFTQEMLKNGYLASKQTYVSYSHTEEIVKDYLKVVGKVFGILKKAIDNNTIVEMLDGPVAHSGFKRLT